MHLHNYLMKYVKKKIILLDQRKKITLIIIHHSWLFTKSKCPTFDFIKRGQFKINDVLVQWKMLFIKLCSRTSHPFPLEYHRILLGYNDVAFFKV